MNQHDTDDNLAEFCGEIHPGCKCRRGGWLYRWPDDVELHWHITAHRPDSDDGSCKP